MVSGAKNINAKVTNSLNIANNPLGIRDSAAKRSLAKLPRAQRRHLYEETLCGLCAFARIFWLF
jgi:hypothetical protein